MRQAFPCSTFTMRSNQSVELTATRCAFTFQMTKTLSLRARSLSVAVAHFCLVRRHRFVVMKLNDLCW